MASGNDITLTIKTALLSATSMEDEVGNGAAALVSVSGEPLIAYQMKQLSKAGIRKFLVEVDVISGAVVAAADRMKQRGIDVEFIRSPQELEGRLGIGELLFVMSDGIIADDALLAEMIAKPSAYIVTVDGRKENERYERIDLNSFWGGLALLDHRSVAAIAALPEGYSVSSSLLRQALQDAVVHRPLNQQLLDGKQLRRIISHEDAQVLTKELLSRRAHDSDGIIEAQLFGPLAARLVPFFWGNPNAGMIMDAIALAVPAIGLGLAFAGQFIFALVISLLSLFLLKLRNLLKQDDKEKLTEQLVGKFSWVLLLLSIFVISWFSDNARIEGLFAPAMLAGILLYCSKSTVGLWARTWLASPASFAIALLILGIFGEWSAGVKLLVLVQLALLLLPLYFKPKRKNA